MGQRPSFDMTRVSTADKILLGGAALFFIDTFLPWQRVCTDLLGVDAFCASANAWGGSGSFMGVLAALLALALLVWEALPLFGVNLNLNIPAATVTAGLAAGVVVFGLIKFLLVVANSPAIGAWLGLILLLVIAYGAYMKWQEAKAMGSTPPGSGFTG